MKIVTVIPLKKGLPREELSYFTSKDIAVGSIVDIPFRNKKILGLVLSTDDVSSAKSDIKDLDFNLKKIIDTKEISVFRPEYLEAAMLASKYFASKSNNGITSLLPAAFREEYDKIANFTGSAPNTSLQNSRENKNLRTEKLLFQASSEDRISYYKNLIRSSFAKKKSTFLVLPTEHDIKIFRETLSRGIEGFTFAIHGSLSAKKQIEIFGQIMASTHPVLVLGTAPYLSIPRMDFETIIIEHESSGAYRTIARPYLDLKVFTELFVSKINARLILGDSLLSYETIARKELDNFGEVRSMSFRTNFSGEIEIPEKEEKFKILSDQSVKEIEETLARGKNVFIFSLRKGLATMTVCQDCGDPLMCDNCFAPVVLYLSKNRDKRMFVCNRCGRVKDPEIICANCQSWNLIPLGVGIDTVLEETEKIFPKTKIFKLDKEAAETKKGAEKIAHEFEESRGAILIGTEIALVYLKEKTPLSVVASFDSLWSIPSFRISERIIRLLELILSRTGQKLIVQTKNGRDQTIRAIKNESLHSFIRDELEDRKNLGYPPFKRFIKITHLGPREQVPNVKRVLSEIFKDYNPDIFSGFVAKERNKYVTNALIKLDPHHWSLPELSQGASIDQILLKKLLSLPPEFYISIDPEDLL